MKFFTLEQLLAKGIADRPTEKAIITNDGELYISIMHEGEEKWIQTGAIALNITMKNDEHLKN